MRLAPAWKHILQALVALGATIVIITGASGEVQLTALDIGLGALLALLASVPPRAWSTLRERYGAPAIQLAFLLLIFSATAVYPRTELRFLLVLIGGLGMALWCGLDE